MTPAAAVPDQLVHRLLAALREETGAHERVLALLDAQESAMANPSSDTFKDATATLEAELARGPHRRKRTTEVMREVASALGVPSSAQTVASIVERLGDRAHALAEERERLANVARDVRAKNVRIAALVRMHRDVTRDLLQTVLGTEGESVHAGGSLIDAEV